MVRQTSNQLQTWGCRTILDKYISITANTHVLRCIRKHSKALKSVFHVIPAYKIPWTEKWHFASMWLCIKFGTKDDSQSFHGWIKMPTFIWDLENIIWIIKINLGAYVLIVGRICPRFRISAFRQQNDYGSFRVK